MATGSYQYLMKIIKQNTLRSSKITDQLRFHALMIAFALPFWFKSFWRPQPSNIITYVFCPFPSRPILLQCSLKIVANQILQWAHRDHNLFFTYKACKFAAKADQSAVLTRFHNLLATLAETPCFLALRLLHPTFRPRTRSQIFEWLEAIFVGILVGHNQLEIINGLAHELFGLFHLLCGTTVRPCT